MDKQKVIFLDRDGTINVDHGYVNEAEQWEWCPGVFEGLKRLQSGGYTLVIVTNQSGVGLGLYSDEQMQKLHHFMSAEIQKHGVTIAAIAHCPHAPAEQCDCRKPRTGMAKQIEKKIGPIDYSQSWMVGDKEKDVQFGQNLFMKTALLRSRYWEVGDLNVEPEIIVGSLKEAAETIVDRL